MARYSWPRSMIFVPRCGNTTSLYDIITIAFALAMLHKSGLILKHSDILE